MVSHLKTPILNCFSHLLWFDVLTDSEFSCLALLASHILCLAQLLLPRIPNQLHFIQESAHEVLGAILEA